MEAPIYKNDHEVKVIEAPGLKGQYYDLWKLHALSNGQLGFLKEMIDVFIEQENQFECTISAAIEEVNWQSIHKTAHKFKSSLKIVGVDHLAVHFEAIHMLAKEQKGMEDVKHHVSIIRNYCKDCVVEMQLFKNTL